ncbi:hypothetical protein C8R46DRAFT_1094728 [Mycena filopes]|nr:hypothetical protein C8R46DRAFT_1094728 [Mycena filopes]
MQIDYQSRCDVSCSLHFALDPDNHHLPESHFELLSTAFGPPSDSQAAPLLEDIKKTEKDIVIASTHISRLQDALQRLTQQRERLQDFVKTHRAVLSVLRRVPDEILLEIFQHAREGIPDPDATATTPWAVSHVCSRWRAVALSSPQLWARFVLQNPSDESESEDDDSESEEPPSVLPPEFPTQLERAGRTPISIDFGDAKPMQAALDLFLPLSSQWEDIVIDYGGLTQISAHNFPALKTLTIVKTTRHTEDGSTISPLPALKHLMLGLNDSEMPRQMPIPWSQLRTFDVHDVDSIDLMWILAHIGHETLVTVSHGFNEVSPPVHAEQTNSVVGSLTLLDGSDGFILDVLDRLVAPSLHSFHFTQGWPRGRAPPGANIVGFFQRSGCTLQQLSLDLHRFGEANLMHVLKSPHLHSLTHLRISQIVLSPPSLAVLASSFPALRMLTMRAVDVDESALLAALARHYPSVVVSRGSANWSPPAAGLRVVLL